MLAAESTLERWHCDLVARGCSRQGRQLTRLADHLLEHGNLPKLLESLSDHFGWQIDEFTEISDFAATSGREGLRRDCQRFRPAVEAAVLVACARLHSRGLAPREVYPGRLVIGLVEDAVSGSRNHLLERVLARVRLVAPAEWEQVHTSLVRACESTSVWSSWPSGETCATIVRDLHRVHAGWVQAIAYELREYTGGENRVRRRDPAYRRALEWRGRTSELFARMGVPSPGLRLLLDYTLAILDAFGEDERNPDGRVNRGIEELLKLEVLSLIEFGFTGDSLPVGLLVGDGNRRKRLQRERLKVFRGYQIRISERQWIDDLLPRIAALGQQIAHDD